MFENKVCRGRALRIAVGITALMLLMAGGVGAGAGSCGPTLLYPGGTLRYFTTTIETLTPTFQWNSVSGADYYILQIKGYSRNYNVFLPRFYSQRINGTAYTLPSGVLQYGWFYTLNILSYRIASKTDYVDNPEICDSLDFQTLPPISSMMQGTLNEKFSDNRWTVDSFDIGNGWIIGASSIDTNFKRASLFFSKNGSVIIHKQLLHEGEIYTKFEQDNPLFEIYVEGIVWHSSTTSDTMTVHFRYMWIGENQPLIASFTYSPEKPQVSEEIIFDASASNDPDGAIIKYNWNLGDGYTSEGKVVNHTYAKAGNYTINLIVTNNKGLQNSTSKVVEVKTIPVILVHGWRGSSAYWKKTADRLRDQGFDVYTFDYSPATEEPFPVYAEKLRIWIKNLRNEKNYREKFDIVSHSMGGLVARWYIEKLGGSADVRQLIMIGTPNHGASIASLTLLRPWDKAAWSMTIKSDSLSQLNYDEPHFNLTKWKSVPESGVRKVEEVGVIYRNIAGEGSGYWIFNYKTPVHKKDEHGQLYWYRTKQGDGVVPLYLQQLEGIGLDYFPNASHDSLISDERIIDRVIEYLKHPSIRSRNDFPPTDPDDNH